MLFRDSFNKMALFALALIVFIGVISFGMIQSNAYYPDGDYSDSAYDSGDDESFSSAITSEDFKTMMRDIAAIRQGSDIFLYFVIPFSFAALFVCKSSSWFYRTFIGSAFE